MEPARESAQRFDNSWFVIERSAAIQSTPVSRYIQDEPVVLVRTADGAIWRSQTAARIREFRCRTDGSGPRD